MTRSRTLAEDRTPGTPAPGCVPGTHEIQAVEEPNNLQRNRLVAGGAVLRSHPGITGTTSRARPGERLVVRQTMTPDDFEGVFAVSPARRSARSRRCCNRRGSGITITAGSTGSSAPPYPPHPPPAGRSGPGPASCTRGRVAIAYDDLRLLEFARLRADAGHTPGRNRDVFRISTRLKRMRGAGSSRRRSGMNWRLHRSASRTRSASHLPNWTGVDSCRLHPNRNRTDSDSANPTIPA